MLERNKRKLTFLDQAVQFFSTAAMQCWTQRACSILTLLPAGLPARRTAGVAGEATENARPENDGQSRNRISGSGKNGPRNSAMALSVIFQSVKFQSPGFLATFSVVFRSCSVSAPSPVRTEQGQ